MSCMASLFSPAGLAVPSPAALQALVTGTKVWYDETKSEAGEMIVT